jgi:hypothetical protein
MLWGRVSLPHLPTLLFAAILVKVSVLETTYVSGKREMLICYLVAVVNKKELVKKVFADEASGDEM